MKILRGGLLVLLSIFLFLIIILSSIFYTFSASLSYDSLEKEVVPIVMNLSGGIDGLIGVDIFDNMDQASDKLKEFCDENPGLPEYSFVFEGKTFILSCDIVEDYEENKNKAMEESIKKILTDIYYSEYDCGFWDCFKETKSPFFLFSEKAKNYWSQKFTQSLIVLFVIVCLIFLFLENKRNVFFVGGSVIVISSLALFKIEGLVGSFVGKDYLFFLNIFFNGMPKISSILLFVGIFFVVFGFIFKLFFGEFLKRKFSKKQISKLVKKEVNKK